MLDDVLPPCGGFIPIRIDVGGYIKRLPEMDMIHRETRLLHLDYGLHFDTLAEARESIPESYSHEGAVLELTEDGGGAAIWMRPDQVEELATRRDKWKGCYGSWPIRTFSI